MAADFITIDRTKPHGNQAVRLAGLIQDVRNLAANLLDNGNRQWDTGNHELLEAKFGLPAGSGANFLTLLSSVSTALEAAILDEFTARVANQ